MKDLSNNNLPDFLIVGAAKSGTTSLHHYLNNFNDICLPTPKEPKYITSRFLKFPLNGNGDKNTEESIVKDYKEYCELFKHYCEGQIIGDASADNLYYYKEAIPQIKELLYNPKIIIVLRNPVQRAYSAYMHMRRELRETFTFQEALMEESKRIEDNHEFIWHYKEAGKYFKQVKAYKEAFPNIKVFLFEDLKLNSKKVVKEIRDFLELEVVEFELSGENYNQSGEPKYPLIKKMIIKSGLIKSFFKKIVPRGFRAKVKEITFSLEKVNILNEDKIMLQEYFRKDIMKLEKLIDRDLSHWLK